jgi:hypothetical protein
MTSRQEKLVEAYIRKQVRKSLNEVSYAKEFYLKFKQAVLNDLKLYDQTLSEYLEELDNTPFGQGEVQGSAGEVYEDYASAMSERSQDKIVEKVFKDLEKEGN